MVEGTASTKALVLSWQGGQDVCLEVREELGSSEDRWVVEWIVPSLEGRYKDFGLGERNRPFEGFAGEA